MDNRIVSIDIVDGELIVTYQDGSTQSLGPISEMDLEQLTAAVVKNAGDIVGLKRADTALQTSVAALDTAVGAAETSIEGVQDDVDDLETEVAGLKNDLNLQTNWENEIEFTVPKNTYNVKRNVFVPQGWVVEITSTVASTSLHWGITYTDGTTDYTNLRFARNKARFRATKDIEKIGFSNETANDAVITISKAPDALKVTNYYDKTAKVSGYIQGGTVQSGYYHSDFIPFVIGETLYFSGYPLTFSTPRLFFYDSEKNYVCSTYGITNVGEDGLYYYETTLTKAAQHWMAAHAYNVAYVSFNMTEAGSDTAVFYRNEKPNTPLAYGQVQPENDMFFNAQQVEYISNSGGQPISGKLIAYNGDSICESRLSSGTTYNGGAYAKLVADATGGTYENRGRGGGTLASGTSATRQVVNDVTNMTDDADLICFEGGINDYWLNVPLGDYTENDYSGTVDTTTICGALESIFRQATAKWVGKPICFIIVHKITSTVYTANTAGYTFAQAREKMIGICNKYAIPYYDAFADSGLNAYNSIQNTNFLTANSTGNPDGCHPNENGYKKYYVPQLIALFNSLMPRS